MSVGLVQLKLSEAAQLRGVALVEVMARAQSLIESAQTWAVENREGQREGIACALARGEAVEPELVLAACQGEGERRDLLDRCRARVELVLVLPGLGEDEAARVAWEQGLAETAPRLEAIEAELAQLASATSADKLARVGALRAERSQLLGRRAELQAVLHDAQQRAARAKQLLPADLRDELRAAEDRVTRAGCELERAERDHQEALGRTGWQAIRKTVEGIEAVLGDTLTHVAGWVAPAASLRERQAVLEREAAKLPSSPTVTGPRVEAARAEVERLRGERVRVVAAIREHLTPVSELPEQDGGPASAGEATETSEASAEPEPRARRRRST